ncbi:S-adenosylmethionine-dependent methyltransferase [Rhizophagus clarus]|uniref:S-adenosylmethionine-dependent methyltransferase n=1 Tax=Rhizophagus clarus TaxID=94130 RepID=A0A8H3LYK7_9GLOM|nr:S-adenosylmethionine-dependent methyltransferase [Rhizophagus clarus]
MFSIATKYFDIFPCEFWSLENFASCAIFNDIGADERNISNAFYGMLHKMKRDPKYSQEAHERIRKLLEDKKYDTQSVSEKLAKRKALSRVENLSTPPKKRKLSARSSNEDKPEESTTGRVISIFSNALVDTMKDPLYRQKLIEIRNLFKGQNYRKIFESENLRNEYTASYSPIRTLCYLNIFNIKRIDFLSNLIALTQQQLNVFCFGSGPGAELAAILQAYSIINAVPRLNIFLHDNFDYTECLQKIVEQFNVKGFNWNLSIGNIISSTEFDGVPWEQISKSHLITACFVICELFRYNPKNTKRFFKKLLNEIRFGAFLMIVDSSNMQYTTYIYKDKSYCIWDYLSRKLLEDKRFDRFSEGMSYFEEDLLKKEAYNLSKCNCKYMIYKKVSANNNDQ